MASETPRGDGATQENDKRPPVSLVVNLTLGLLFSAAFVYLVVSDIDWDKLESSADSIEWWAVGAYFGILSFTHLLRLIRWSMTVRRIGEMPWGRLMAICAVGMMAVFSLPARLGEIARPVLVAREGRIGVGEVMATVVVERLTDGLCVSAMLLLTVLALDPNQVEPAYIYSGYAAAALFGTVALGMLVLGVFFPRIRLPLHKVLARIHEGLAEKIVATLGSFFKGLKLLGKPGFAAFYGLFTVVIWGVSGLAIQVLFQAFPGQVAELGSLAAFATLGTIVVGVMIPSGPGTVGVFHWAVAFGLSMFAIGEESGLLVGTVLHLMVAAVNIGYGLVGWIFGGVSLRGIWRPRARSVGS